MGGPGSGRRPRQPGRALAVRQPSEIAVPRRPVGLADRGRREWAAIWTAGAAWLQPDRDYHWIEQIARAYDEIADYRRQIRADGAVQRGSQGQPVSHPLIAEVRKLEDRIDKNLGELGLSPTAAARLGLAAAKTASKLDELAERRAKRDSAPPAVTVTAEVVEDGW